ncbi:ester cyclase [Caenimonas sedimenti]|uniref:Ester cyclase n=1 Tax=Caenimonas sedimenti TaxID=2596921 RepID=A0A562ZW60_9BURK|nr:SnoaL-like domain-containing protein [Caenimonas sedimenti]TWO72616.1 ester cyclase [Caenimonas sedimenti]
MDTKTLAHEFTKLCQDGQFDEAGNRFWSEQVVSLEPMEGEMARAQGRKALEGKGQWWYANHEIHSTSTEGPYVHGDQFAVRFNMDITPKTGDTAGQRIQMTEVGLYTVKDGKITEERFFYGG